MQSSILPCKVDNWRQAFLQRYEVKKTVTSAVKEAISCMLYQDEIPRCILRLLGNYNDLAADAFLASSVIDELYLLSKPSW